MLELQEQQHRRIVMLSSAALVFAAFACWELFQGFFSRHVYGEGRAHIYLLSCIVLMASTITVTMIRSFMDYNTIRTGHLFDQVTGLASRASFMQSLAGELEKLAVGEGLAVIFADIRRFKSLNHSFGHEAGDSIIKAVADRLRQIGLERAVLARLEGGRFAILVPGTAKRSAVVDIAAAVQRSMVPPFVIDQKNIYVDFSLGSAHISETDGVDAVEAMRRAEFALLESKAADGAHMCYSDGSAQTARRASTIETGLRETVETDEIDIYFQPLVDTRFDRIVAVEALARWTHPQYGRVPPLDFVGMAESLGLVCKLGLSILRRACAMAATLPDIRLAVNISPRHFLAPGFASDVKAVLDETGFPASRLELEITENILLSDSSEAREAVAGVRALGVSVALDDFGTGYSGLSYLNIFTVDRIKIDRSFMVGIERSARAQSIVSNIIRLARERSIAVTVEGIETMDQVLYLRRFGFLWLQGYLFARPMPFDQLVEAVRVGREAPPAIAVPAACTYGEGERLSA